MAWWWGAGGEVQLEAGRAVFGLEAVLFPLPLPRDPFEGPLPPGAESRLRWSLTALENMAATLMAGST